MNHKVKSKNHKAQHNIRAQIVHWDFRISVSTTCWINPIDCLHIKVTVILLFGGQAVRHKHQKYYFEPEIPICNNLFNLDCIQLWNILCYPLVNLLLQNQILIKCRCIFVFFPYCLEIILKTDRNNWKESCNLNYY